MSSKKPNDLFNHPAWRAVSHAGRTNKPNDNGEETPPMLEADGLHAIDCAKAGDWKPLLDLACVHGFLAGYEKTPTPKSEKKSSALDAFKNFSDSIEASCPLVFQALEATSKPGEATESLLACCPPQAIADFCGLLLSCSEPSMFAQGPEEPIIETLVSHADPIRCSQTLFDNALGCAETALVSALHVYLKADQNLGLFSAEQKSQLLLAALHKDRVFSSSDKMKCVDLLLDFGASLWDHPGCQQLSLIEQAAEGAFDLNWNYICESKISPQQLGYAPGDGGDLLCQRLAEKIELAKQEAASPQDDDNDEEDFWIDQPTSPYLNIQAASQEYPWHVACLDWMLLRAQMRQTPTAPKTIKHL